MSFTWKITRGFILSIFITSRVWSSPVFPHEHENDAALSEEEEDEEDTDDVYDEEEIISTAKPKPVKKGTLIKSEDDEEEDDPGSKVALEEKLGSEIHSIKSTSDENTSNIGKISYATEIAPKLSALHHKKGNSKPPPVPFTSPSKQYKISRTTTTSTASPLGGIIVAEANSSNETQTRKLLIKLPPGMMGSEAGTIEIDIPLKMLLQSKEASSASTSSTGVLDRHQETSQMSISSQDELDIRNSIQTALLEALLGAQRLNLSSLPSGGNKKEKKKAGIALDIVDTSSIPTESEGESSTTGEVTTASSTTPDSTTFLPTTLLPSSTPPYSPPELGDIQALPSTQLTSTATNPIESQGASTTRRPTRRRRVRSTAGSTTTTTTTSTAATPKVSATLKNPINDLSAMGLVADMVLLQITNGLRNPEVAIVNFVQNTVRVVQRVECVVFDYCDD